jgi:site-specific DNA recombinase
MMTEISYSGYRFPPSLAVGAEAPSLLAGLIVDAGGNRMTPAHATKRAKRYRYYWRRLITCKMRVPAGDIEGLVLDRLRALFSSRIEVSDALASLHLEARALDAALRNAFALSERWRPSAIDPKQHQGRSPAFEREEGN